MSFVNDLERLINKYSLENESNTPDFILAQYLQGCLTVYNRTIRRRAVWYGRMDVPGMGSLPYDGTDDKSDSIDDGEQDVIMPP